MDPEGPEIRLPAFPGNMTFSNLFILESHFPEWLVNEVNHHFTNIPHIIDVQVVRDRKDTILYVAVIRALGAPQVPLLHARIDKYDEYSGKFFWVPAHIPWDDAKPEKEPEDGTEVSGSGK